VNGAFIEAGCALGGSAILIAKCKPRDRHLYVYDTFGMIPPPTEQDGREGLARFSKIVSGKSSGLGGEQYYGYRTNLIQDVIANMRAYNVECERENVHLIQGHFESTLWVQEPIALAHLDCDWYESLRLCFGRIAPFVSFGGYIIVDDYNHKGARSATDSFLAEHSDFIAVGWRRSLMIKRFKAIDRWESFRSALIEISDIANRVFAMFVELRQFENFSIGNRESNGLRAPLDLEINKAFNCAAQNRNFWKFLLSQIIRKNVVVSDLHHSNWRLTRRGLNFPRILRFEREYGNALPT
jgi:hypothetical protein